MLSWTPQSNTRTWGFALYTVICVVPSRTIPRSLCKAWVFGRTHILRCLRMDASTKAAYLQEICIYVGMQQARKRNTLPTRTHATCPPINIVNQKSPIGAQSIIEHGGAFDCQGNVTWKCCLGSVLFWHEMENISRKPSRSTGTPILNDQWHNKTINQKLLNTYSILVPIFGAYIV